MKKGLKALLLVMCAIVLVVATVFTTLAFLQDNTDTIKNTFSVGNVDISMVESKYENGELVPGETISTGTNTYPLIPGREYKKDPVITVVGNSETSWVFVKVTNRVQQNILEGLDMAAGWTELDGVDDVYYTQYTKQAEAKEINVFAQLDGAADGMTVRISGNVENGASAADVDVTAYAVQMEGFEGNAKAAWEATFGA